MSSSFKLSESPGVPKTFPRSSPLINEINLKTWLMGHVAYLSRGLLEHLLYKHVAEISPTAMEKTIKVFTIALQYLPLSV